MPSAGLLQTWPTLVQAEKGGLRQCLAVVLKNCTAKRGSFVGWPGPPPKPSPSMRTWLPGGPLSGVMAQMPGRGGSLVTLKVTSSLLLRAGGAVTTWILCATPDADTFSGVASWYAGGTLMM